MNKFILIALVALINFSCGESSGEKRDLLLGKWQVAVVERGEDVIGGRNFHGSYFEFRADSTVYAYNSLDLRNDQL